MANVEMCAINVHLIQQRLQVLTSVVFELKRVGLELRYLDLVLTDYATPLYQGLSRMFFVHHAIYQMLYHIL